jgi:hypothetical protein
MVQNKIYKKTLETQGSHYDTVGDLLDMTEFEDHQNGNTPLLNDSESEDVVANLCMGMAIGDEANHKPVAIVQLLKRMCNSYDDQDTQPFSLASWIAHNASRKIGNATLEEHLDIYLAEHARQHHSETPDGDSSNFSDADDFERAQLTIAIEEGFEMLERLRMTFAVTGSGSLMIVHRDGQPGDHLYILQNCPLPVILRQTRTPGHFNFVGEVFASKHFQKTVGTVACNMKPVCIE